MDSQVEEEKAVSFRSGHLAGDRTQGPVDLTVELETVHQDLHDHATEGTISPRIPNAAREQCNCFWREFMALRAGLAFPRPPKSLGKVEKIGFNGGGWVYNRKRQEAKTEIPAEVKTAVFGRLTMTKLWQQPVITAAMICLCVGTSFGDSDENTLRAKLIGFNEIPQKPAPA